MFLEGGCCWKLCRQWKIVDVVLYVWKGMVNRLNNYRTLISVGVLTLLTCERVVEVFQTHPGFLDESLNSIRTD